MTESKDTSLGVQTLAGSGALAVQQLLGFVSAMLLGYIVGPSGFGGFYLIVAVVEIADAPVQGWSGAAKKFYAESNSNRREIVGSELLIGTVVSVLGASVIWLLRNQINTITGFSNGWILLLAFYVVAVFYRPIHGLLTSTGKLAQKEGLATVHSGLKFVGQASLLIIGYGATGMVLGYTIASLLVLPIAFYLLGNAPAIPSGETIKTLYGFAKFSAVTSLVRRAFNRYDILLLAILGSPAIAGYYEAAFKLTTPAFVVSSVGAGGILARVSNLQSHDDDPTGDIRNVLSYASILSIPIFFGALALGRPLLVYAFGSGFEAAGSLLVGLAFWRIIASQNNVLTSVVNGANHPKKTAIISALTLGINIPLGIVLFYTLGPLGVVVATIIAEGIRYFGLMIVVSQVFPRTTLIPKPVFSQAIAGAIMYGTVRIVRNSMGTGSLFYIGVLLATGIFVYTLSLLVLSSHLRQTVRGTIADLVTAWE